MYVMLIGLLGGISVQILWRGMHISDKGNIYLPCYDKGDEFSPYPKMDNLKRKCGSCNIFRSDVTSNHQRVTDNENVKHSTIFISRLI